MLLYGVKKIIYSGPITAHPVVFHFLSLTGCHGYIIFYQEHRFAAVIKSIGVPL